MYKSIYNDIYRIYSSKRFMYELVSNMFPKNDLHAGLYIYIFRTWSKWHHAKLAKPAQNLDIYSIIICVYIYISITEVYSHLHDAHDIALACYTIDRDNGTTNINVHDLHRASSLWTSMVPGIIKRLKPARNLVTSAAEKPSWQGRAAGRLVNRRLVNVWRTPNQEDNNPYLCSLCMYVLIKSP